MSNTRKAQALIGLAAAAVVAVLLFFLLTSDGTRRQSDAPVAATEDKARVGVRIDRPARLTIVLEEPRANSEYKLGEPINVKGRVEVPEGKSIFEQEVYFQNQQFIRKAPATFASGMIPLVASDGRYSFEKTWDDPKSLPKKPGTYEIKVTAPSLLEELEQPEGGGAKPTTASVRYRVVRGPEK